MLKKEFLITNKSGLHARPAGVLVKTLLPFSSSVKLCYNDKAYEAKSVLGIMSACIQADTMVTFEVDGPDEVEVMQAIEAAVNNKFGETE